MNKNKNVKNRRNFLSKMLVVGASGATLLSTSAYARGKKRNATPQLTEEQKDTLFYIYQEEKLARDTYIKLGEVYTNENTFASIQISEQRHIDSARELCTKYGVDISHVNEDSVGEFELPILQEHYDTFMIEGDHSLLDALKVGEHIEVMDIDDLETAAVGMPSDVANVFNQLKEGSLNHLEAFEAAIARAQ